MGRDVGKGWGFGAPDDLTPFARDPASTSDPASKSKSKNSPEEVAKRLKARQQQAAGLPAEPAASSTSDMHDDAGRKPSWEVVEAQVKYERKNKWPDPCAGSAGSCSSCSTAPTASTMQRDDAEKAAPAHPEAAVVLVTGTPVIGGAGPDARCSELRAWMDELGIDAGDAAQYAAALVELGVDAPADVVLLREGDWPAAIKPVHLRKMQEDALRRQARV